MTGAENGVTIGMPAYNARKTIERAIDSALSQTIDLPFEVLVVDDGSSDTTANIALSYQLMHPNKVRVINCPNRGVAAARNSVVRNARYDHLTWLDADDYYEPHKLEVQYDALILDRMLAGCEPGGSDVIVFSPVLINGEVFDFSRYFENPIRSILCGEFRAYLWASMTGIEAYREVGEFNEVLHRSEDTDWLLRYLTSGPRKLISTDIDRTVMHYHFSTRRDGEKVEASFKFLCEQYGELMNLHGIFDEYVPRRYWEISNFYHSNQKWEDMWRCRALAVKHNREVYGPALEKELQGIADPKYRAHLQKLISSHLA